MAGLFTVCLSVDKYRIIINHFKQYCANKKYDYLCEKLRINSLINN